MTTEELIEVIVLLIRLSILLEEAESRPTLDWV